MWSVPKMWEGQPCVIFAGGESMTQEVAEVVRPVGRYRTIAINNTIELVPWADMLYAADATWWQVYKAKALAFQGLKVTCSANPFPEVLELKTGGMDGFDPDPGVICTGGNSGYQALCIAVHAGCPRVLLCGFNMCGAHWHKPHKAPLRETGADLYDEWIKRFGTLVKPLEDRGVEVVNCTPNSALKWWPSRPLEDALSEPLAVLA